MPPPNALREKSYNGDMMREGREGEAEVLSFLKSLPRVLRVEDVRDHAAWRAKDVDFLVHRMARPVERVEAKADRHIADTQNFCFELGRVAHAGETLFRMGWSVFTEASLVYVWCASANRLYAFSTSDIREGFRRYCREAKQMRIVPVQTDNQRTTLNALVPLTYIPHSIYVRSFDRWLVKQD